MLIETFRAAMSYNSHDPVFWSFLVDLFTEEGKRGWQPGTKENPAES